MGGKASNLFADVIMNYIVDKAMEITHLQNRLLCFTNTLMIVSASSMIKSGLLKLRKFKQYTPQHYLNNRIAIQESLKFFRFSGRQQRA